MLFVIISSISAIPQRIHEVHQNLKINKLAIYGTECWYRKALSTSSTNLKSHFLIPAIIYFSAWWSHVKLLWYFVFLWKVEWVSKGRELLAPVVTCLFPRLQTFFLLFSVYIFRLSYCLTNTLEPLDAHIWLNIIIFVNWQHCWADGC